MTENEFFLMLGRKQAALDELQTRYDRTLKAFSEVVSGECDTTRVAVNLTTGEVTWAAPGERPPSVMQINGMPNVVMDTRPSRAELEATIAGLQEEIKVLKDAAKLVE